MTVRLRATGSYRDTSLGVSYRPGEEFQVDEERARFLERDAPESFERVKAMAAPPANKAVLEAPESKGPTEDDLTVIDGISDTRQRQLQFAGIYTYADLAEANAGTLTQLHGVGQATAERWRAEAREML